MTDAANSGAFNLTRWTLVERTRGDSPESREALRELCAAYYAPVVAFLRSEGRTDDAARDLAHEFFARLLAGDSLFARREQGRFRSYLLGAVKHFVLNKRREAACQRRAGDREHLSIGPGTEESGSIDVADPRSEESDAFFDREWALAIIERVLDSLQRKSESDGTGKQFAAIKPWLSPAGTMQSQATIAEQLNMSEGAVKVAIHRLRKQFREYVRNEIMQTLNDPADLDEEMQHLIHALAKNHA